jgi:AcrR family transcriptional regulator
MSSRPRTPSDAVARAATASPACTREEILAAAARLFRQQGYVSTTLRQIAEAAGIKAGSIYYHFESKDEIAARVLDAGIEAVAAVVAARLAALAPGAGSRERLGMAIEGHLRGMLHHGDFTSAHIRIYRHVSESARERHRAVRSAYTRLWDGLLADAAAAGVVRGDVPLSMIRQFLIGALNWPVDWYDPRRGSFERFAAQMASLVLDGIAAPEAA